MTTDQRGGARPKGPRCDAGAFELAYGVAFDSGPSGPTSDARPTFAFSSSETVDGFRCRFDGPDGAPGTPAPCTSPMTAAFPLREGAYTLTVEALRNDEPIDTATRSFSVDQTAPVVEHRRGPATGHEQHLRALRLQREFPGDVRMRARRRRARPVHLAVRRREPRGGHPPVRAPGDRRRRQHQRGRLGAPGPSTAPRRPRP